MANTDNTTHSSGSPKEKSRSKNVMKWIGVATAVLSLIFGLQQLASWLLDYRAKRREIAEYIDLGNMQRASHDYHAAWASLEKAYALDSDNDGVNRAREDLAMEWLENIRVRSDQETFTDVVDRILPALRRGALKSEEQRKADLLAHIGWADFLRWRDGNVALEPEASYRQALAVDSSNVYAHAMWGHWILWQHGDIERAKHHFAKALAAGRKHDYARRMQLSALLNVKNEHTEAEIIRVCNAMRQNNETFDDSHRNAIWGVYSSIGGRIRSAHVDSGFFEEVIPREQELATFRWLFEDWDRTADNTVYLYLLACLQEAAGQHEVALQAFLNLRQNASSRSVFLHRIDAAIKRLHMVVGSSG